MLKKTVAMGLVLVALTIGALAAMAEECDESMNCQEATIECQDVEEDHRWKLHEEGDVEHQRGEMRPNDKTQEEQVTETEDEE